MINLYDKYIKLKSKLGGSKVSEGQTVEKSCLMFSNVPMKTKIVLLMNTFKKLVEWPKFVILRILKEVKL